ncbi:caprin-2-like [Haliotis asinina]|uniref:caprin-2-like n=1 Tax=Haliotis asinina TaxID=109174 RepID=UPI0035322EA5
MSVLDTSLFALVLVCPMVTTTTPDLASVSLQVQQLQTEVSDLTSELANVTGELVRHQSEVRKFASYVENIQRIVAFGSRHGQFGVEASVGFQAELGMNPAPVLDREVLTFSHVSQNRGDCYNASTGIFTAPVGGIYLFWCNIINYDRHNSLSIYIFRDGKPLNYAMAPPDVYQGTATVSSLTHMKVGSKVWFVKHKGSESLQGAGWSSYGGTLIKVG